MEHNDKQEGRVIPWRAVSLVGLVPLVTASLLSLNAWNDARYVRLEVFTLAQSQNSSNSLKLDNLSQQVNSLQVQSAISVVSAFQQELDRHMRNPEQSLSWQFERDRLIRQLERAEQYRDCLMNQRPLCEKLRGW